MADLRLYGAGVVCKTTVLLNVNHGPWKQGDFLRQKSEAVQLALDTFSPESPWFCQYVEQMCFDQGLSYDTEPELLYDSVMDCNSFKQSGIYVGPISSVLECTTLCLTAFKQQSELITERQFPD